MRLRATLFALLMTFVASFAANADEKAIQPSTLKNVGLSTLRPISAKEGMKVRGQGGSAATAGLSFVSGMLIDPTSKSYVFGVDTNHASTCYDVSCIVGLIDPVHTTESRLNLGLTVDNSFVGVITGAAFGGATAYIR